MCDTDREGIQNCSREPDMGSDIDHTYSRERIVTHGYGQGNDNDDKSQRFLAHAEDRPETTKQKHNHRNNDVIDT